MKLPKPRKRGDAYRIEIMFDGTRYSCTRDTGRECEQWAALKLLELKTGKAPDNIVVKPAFSFKQLFEQYYQEHGRNKKSKAWIYGQLKTFDEKFGALGEMSIHDITPKHLTASRNKRST